MNEIFVKDLVFILGGSTKILILNLTNARYKKMWEGIVDDIDLKNIPYGEYSVKHLAMNMNDNCLQIHIVA